MFASITVVSFIFAFAWVQQIFMNRLIEADIEALKRARYESLKKQSDSQLQ